MSRIMIVEDDQRLSRLIADYLEQHAYTTFVEHCGSRAVDVIRRVKPDVVVLDMMLPGKDGQQICRELRQWSNLPVLMLTAREEDIDQILSLEAGADDYVVKPVEPRVLLARIRALLRRQNATVTSPERWQFGALCIDSATRYLREDEEYFVFSVDDDGHGIPSVERTRVFEPFVRLDSSRSRATGGFGLGLAIVQQIVKSHQGEVWIEDSSLGGTRVVIRWPV